MNKLIIFLICNFVLLSSATAQWNPHKPIYVHSADVKILEANPNLYSYRHLTNHYFYNKPGPNGETYDLRSIDPRRFKEQYLDNDERRWRYDVNHPWMPESMILDLEMNPIWRVDDPDWWRWTQDYLNIMRMTKGAGIPVGVYGIYLQASEYQTWWNLGRFKWFLDPKLNPKYYDATAAQKRQWQKKLEEYTRKEDGLIFKLDKLNERFGDDMDAAVIELYMGYEIPSMDEDCWQWYAWRYLVEQKIAAYSLAFPEKPIYVFIQPNFTVGWKPVPVDMWKANLEYIMSNEDVDRIYIFNSRKKEKAKGWDSILINGELR